MPSAWPRPTTFVSPVITGTPASLAVGRDRVDHCVQIRQWQPLRQNHPQRQPRRLGAAHRQIVHRPRYRQPPDVAARETATAAPHTNQSSSQSARAADRAPPNPAVHSGSRSPASAAIARPPIRPSVARRRRVPTSPSPRAVRGLGLPPLFLTRRLGEPLAGQSVQSRHAPPRSASTKLPLQRPPPPLIRAYLKYAWQVPSELTMHGPIGLIGVHALPNSLHS